MESKYIGFLQSTIEDVVDEIIFVREIAEVFESQHLTTSYQPEEYLQPLGQVIGECSKDMTDENKHLLAQMQYLLAVLENRLSQLERRFAELDHQPSCSTDCWDEWDTNPPELQKRITFLKSHLYWLEGVFKDEKQRADDLKQLFRIVQTEQPNWNEIKKLESFNTNDGSAQRTDECSTEFTRDNHPRSTEKGTKPKTRNLSEINQRQHAEDCPSETSRTKECADEIYISMAQTTAKKCVDVMNCSVDEEVPEFNKKLIRNNTSDNNNLQLNTDNVREKEKTSGEKERNLDVCDEQRLCSRTETLTEGHGQEETLSNSSTPEDQTVLAQSENLQMEGNTENVTKGSGTSTTEEVDIYDKTEENSPETPLSLHSRNLKVH